MRCIFLEGGFRIWASSLSPLVVAWGDAHVASLHVTLYTSNCAPCTLHLTPSKSPRQENGSRPPAGAIFFFKRAEDEKNKRRQPEFSQHKKMNNGANSRRSRLGLKCCGSGGRDPCWIGSAMPGSLAALGAGGHCRQLSGHLTPCTYTFARCT